MSVKNQRQELYKKACKFERIRVLYTLRRKKRAVERWLSWSKAHDWKSCLPLKGNVGSNPTLSAKNKSTQAGALVFAMRWRDSKVGIKNHPANGFPAPGSAADLATPHEVQAAEGEAENPTLSAFLK